MLDTGDLQKLYATFPGINLRRRLRHWRDVGSLFDEVDNAGKTFAKKYHNNAARVKLLLRYVIQEKKDEMPATAINSMLALIRDKTVAQNSWRPGIDRVKSLLFNLDLLCSEGEGGWQRLIPPARGEDFKVVATRYVNGVKQWFLEPDSEFQYCIIQHDNPVFEKKDIDDLVFEYNEIDLSGPELKKEDSIQIMDLTHEPDQKGPPEITSIRASFENKKAESKAIVPPSSLLQQFHPLKGYTQWPFPKFQVMLHKQPTDKLDLAIKQAKISRRDAKLFRATHCGDSHPDIARALEAGYLQDGDIIYCNSKDPANLSKLRTERPIMFIAVRVPLSFTFHHPSHIPDMLDAPVKAGPILDYTAAEEIDKLLESAKDGDDLPTPYGLSKILEITQERAVLEMKEWKIGGDKPAKLYLQRPAFKGGAIADAKNTKKEDLSLAGAKADGYAETVPSISPQLPVLTSPPAHNGPVASISEGGLSSAMKRANFSDSEEEAPSSKKLKMEVEPETEEEGGEEEDLRMAEVMEMPEGVLAFLKDCGCLHIEILVKSVLTASERPTARQALALAHEAVGDLISPRLLAQKAAEAQAVADLRDLKERLKRAKQKWATGFLETANELRLGVEDQTRLSKNIMDQQFELLMQKSPLNRGKLVRKLQEIQAETLKLEKVEDEWRKFSHRLWFQKVTPRMTSCLTDPRCRLHKTGDSHMEHYLRHDVTVKAIERLAEVKPAERLRVHNAVSPEFIQEVDVLMYAVHIEEYLLPLRDKIAKLGREPVQLLRNSKDTTGNKDSWESARVAAAGSLQMCDEVVRGLSDTGFAGVRPPGHHAGREETDGFCLLNNIVFCTKYIKKVKKHWRIATIDFDVHHGDGTQDILAYLKDDDIFFSTLQIVTSFKSESHSRSEAFFPGTGEQRELDSLYNVYNHPVDGPIRRKDFYKFGKATLEKLREFKPDVILISAGFDAHKDDPSFKDMVPHKYEGDIEADDYYYLTALFANFAREHCFGRIISCLEGGYNREVLGGCIISHVEALMHQGNLKKHKFVNIHNQFYAKIEADEKAANANNATTRKYDFL